MAIIEEKLISIIVPAYNAEKTIDESLRRILAQTYQNIEIIVINDGSSDKTEAIIRSIMYEDSRVKLVTQKNSGVGSARNAGIKCSTGDYITFCDADDYPTKQWIEVLCAGMRDGVELSICSYQRCTSKAEIVEEPDIFEAKLLAHNSIWSLYRSLLLNTNWNKLYKQKRIIDEGIRFGDAKNGEDLEFNLNYLSGMAGHISFNEAKVYVYMDNPESVTHHFIPNKWDETVHRMARLKEVLIEYDVFTPDIQKEFNKFYLSRIESCIANCMLENTCFFQKIRSVNNISKSKECRMLLKALHNRELSHMRRMMKNLRPLCLFGVFYLLYQTRNEIIKEIQYRGYF